MLFNSSLYDHCSTSAEVERAHAANMAELESKHAADMAELERKHAQVCATMADYQQKLDAAMLSGDNELFKQLMLEMTEAVQNGLLTSM